jgi:aconitate hydratase
MSAATRNTFDTRTTLDVDGRSYVIHSLERFERAGFAVARFPFSLKILLENLLRNEDGLAVRPEDVKNLAGWSAAAVPDREIAFTPARVLLQDFTGVPCVVDLAAMRDAMAEMGGDASKINPLFPSELVIDHSFQVDHFGSKDAFRLNSELEYERNHERYAFLRWGQGAFDNFSVVPPDTGIVHQVNLEYLARVVFDAETNGERVAYPDTLVGTDSHTTMVNGLGVLGWGVGGIEAEAAMLGQAMAFLIPEVVGFKLHGRLPEGATATDLVLTVTQMLRKKGVVGKFVEFYGRGLSSLSLADRATIGNMSPEYGSTCAIFPIDSETIEYLRVSGRSPERLALVEAYAKAQGLFRTDETPDPVYNDTIELDLSTVVPSLAGPRRPQDRVSLAEMKPAWAKELPGLVATAKKTTTATADDLAKRVPIELDGAPSEIGHGSVVIASITSCTNTSNPTVLVGAGLLAKKAVEKGLRRKPWVKTSLAPGSKVVTEYLREAGLTPALEALGFHLVGYGCATCIGNSGPLLEPVAQGIREGHLVAVSVLSGNRNFEGRINPDVRANYLASPPLVVAYALAGRIDFDPYADPIGEGSDGKPVYLRDIWPSPEEVRDTVRRVVRQDMFVAQYAKVFEGDDAWRALPTPEGDRFAWDAGSTYIRRPNYFEGMKREPSALVDVENARVLAMLGDSVTTDHISPAGSIAKDSPAAKYLMEHGVAPKDFNQYGARRGNHEVMIRGTFANVRLKNELVPGVEGGFTRVLPDGGVTTIYDASIEYQAKKVPLLVIAGKEYGSGSSRDWAAKGTFLLGVRAVIAESYERIHRSNLIGMGVLPLQFLPGQTRQTIGLTGDEDYAITGIADELCPGKRLAVTARGLGTETRFEAIARIDTPLELVYYRHGGILQYVLRQLL